MKNLKTYIKYSSFSLLAIFITLLLISTLYYFNILNDKLVNYLNIFIVLIIMFISSYKLGSKTEEKGYLEGLKLGTSTLLFFLIISLIFFNNYFQLRLIFYYFIILITCVFGSMVGISKEKKN